MTDDQEHHRPSPLDGPTVMGPVSGNLDQSAGSPPEDPTVPARPGGGQPDEPTLAEPAAGSAGTDDEATIAWPTGDGRPIEQGEQPATRATSGPDEPTAAQPGGSDDEPTIDTTDEPTTIEPAQGGWPSDRGEQPATGNHHDEPTIAAPVTGDDEPTIAQPIGDDEVTVAVGSDEPTVATGADEATTTGPTVGDWPFDQFEPPPPEELVWRAEASPPVGGVASARRPGYYIALGAAVVLVVGLVALAAFVAVMRPRQLVAGDAASAGVPEITTTSPVPTATTSTTAPGPFAELAAHPLSGTTTRMAEVTCELPRFDPADDRQADFYAAAKVCADGAWRSLLSGAGLKGEVTIVTLTGPAQTQTCGELTVTSPATQCDGVVYLTPAYLRDTEQNGRYPGRYLGVFLREYARALQFTNGIDELAARVTTESSAELDTRVEQQATCLAGVMAGAMAGRGAVDGNITGEIRDRLTTVDAPADAGAWLDKGFQQRTPATCNSWAG